MNAGGTLPIWMPQMIPTRIASATMSQRVRSRNGGAAPEDDESGAVIMLRLWSCLAGGAGLGLT